MIVHDIMNSALHAALYAVLTLMRPSKSGITTDNRVHKERVGIAKRCVRCEEDKIYSMMITKYNNNAVSLPRPDHNPYFTVSGSRARHFEHFEHLHVYVPKRFGRTFS